MAIITMIAAKPSGGEITPSIRRITMENNSSDTFKMRYSLSNSILHRHEKIMVKPIYGNKKPQRQ